MTYSWGSVGETLAVVRSSREAVTARMGRDKKVSVPWVESIMVVLLLSYFLYIV